MPHLAFIMVIIVIIFMILCVVFYNKNSTQSFDVKEFSTIKDSYFLKNPVMKKVSKNGKLKLKNKEYKEYNIGGEIIDDPVFINGFYYCIVKSLNSQNFRFLRFDSKSFHITPILETFYFNIQNVKLVKTSSNNYCEITCFGNKRMITRREENIEYLFNKMSKLSCFCLDKNHIEECFKNYNYVYFRRSLEDVRKEILNSIFIYDNVVFTKNKYYILNVNNIFQKHF